VQKELAADSVSSVVVQGRPVTTVMTADAVG